MKRGIAYILIFFFALQSCAVYNKTPVSIYEAVKTSNTDKRKTKVKVELYGKEQKFDYLEFRDDSLYYGIRGNKATQLTKPYRAYSVYFKNEPASTVLTIAIPVAIIGVIIIYINNFTIDIF